MTAPLTDTTATAAPDLIEELAVVRLVHGITVDASCRLPAGSLGAVVFVHDEGQAYEVEFTDPIAALVTLRRGEIEPTETTRARVATTDGVHHRRR